MNTQTWNPEEYSTSTGSVPPGAGYIPATAVRDHVLRVLDADIRTLIRRLRDARSPSLVDEIQDEVFRLGKDAVPELLEAVQNSNETAATRAALLEVLVELDSHASRVVVLRACADPDPRLREVAVEALGSRPLDAQARDILTRLASEDRSRIVQQKAAEILGA